MNRDFHVLSALFVFTASLAMLFGLLWHYDQKTVYIYLPYVVKEYYPREEVYVIEKPVILPCPGDIRTLDPYIEPKRKRQVAEGEE